MRGIATFLGTLLMIGSGIATFVFWMGSLYHWAGGLGIFLGIILSPGIVIFPLVYWVIEGVFPALYFVIWAVGWLGLLLRALGSRD